MKKLRVLVGCEFSGVVRRAFRDLGHDAWSCDLLPAEDGSEFHFEYDVLHAIRGRNDPAFGFPQLMPWDLLIAHPPCTYLCNSGVRWFYENVDAGQVNILGRMMRCTKKGKNYGRFSKMELACDLFSELYWSKIPHICIENPVMHGHARDYLLLARQTPGHSMTIQPWQYGHNEVKRTCLWLRNLPPLKPTNIVEGRHPRVHLASPGPDRWKERSRTYEGVGKAMAIQWSEYLMNL